jgi:tetrahydromethanopterin S-methyltransferase subunit D
MQQSFVPRACNGSQNVTPAAQATGAVGTGVTTINLPAGAPYDGETSARFLVDGSQNIAWAYGNATGLTYANGCVMLGNSVEVFGIPAGVTQISVIANAAGSTLRVVIGDGS